MATGFKQATVNASDVPSTQTDFPAYVDLSRIGIVSQAEADSVRCYSDSGKTTELAREIVSTSEMHVKIPSLTSSFTLYVDYDGARSDYATTATYGAEAVWSDYEAVYHMESATDTLDSAGNHDLTTEVGSIATATGQVGGSRDFSSDSFTKTGGNLDGSTFSNLSVTAWINPDTNGDSNNRAIATHGRYSSGYDWSWFADYQTGKAAMSVYTGKTATGRMEMLGTTTMSTGTWYHVAWIWNSSVPEGEIFLNAVSDVVESTAPSTMVNNITHDVMYVGRYENNFGDRYFDGKIDELRLRNGVLSDDWITTEYNNQSDESGFWGTWTTVGGGGGGSTNNSIFAFGGT